MKVCFVSPEFFSWGVYGGFGYVTRTLTAELAKRGIEVSVVTIRRQGQKSIEEVDGVKIFSYPQHWVHSHFLKAILTKKNSLRYYRQADADIYHSQEVSYNTVVAQFAVPKKAHIITFQDPYDSVEWKRISEVDSRYRMTCSFKCRIWVEKKILKNACSKSNALYSQAKFLIGKAKLLYDLEKTPELLPNPIRIPDRRMTKSPRPKFCFLARWDPQKRVEKFLDLAKKFPEAEFIAMGQGHNLPNDARIRSLYKNIPNLNLTGFVTEEEKSRILEESWALINTSIREALPISFLEALAHQTSIISGEDPDGITSTYGFRVYEDNYSHAIRKLIESNDWVEKAKNGQKMVKETNEVDKVVGMHLDAYHRVLEDL